MAVTMPLTVLWDVASVLPLPHCSIDDLYTHMDTSLGRFGVVERMRVYAPEKQLAQLTRLGCDLRKATTDAEGSLLIAPEERNALRQMIAADLILVTRCGPPPAGIVLITDDVDAFTYPVQQVKRLGYNVLLVCGKKYLSGNHPLGRSVHAMLCWDTDIAPSNCDIDLLVSSLSSQPGLPVDEVVRCMTRQYSCVAAATLDLALKHNMIVVDSSKSPPTVSLARGANAPRMPPTYGEVKLAPKLTDWRAQPSPIGRVTAYVHASGGVVAVDEIDSVFRSVYNVDGALVAKACLSAVLLGLLTTQTRGTSGIALATATASTDVLARTSPSPKSNGKGKGSKQPPSIDECMDKLMEWAREYPPGSPIQKSVLGAKYATAFSHPNRPAFKTLISTATSRGLLVPDGTMHVVYPS